MGRIVVLVLCLLTGIGLIYVLFASVQDQSVPPILANTNRLGSVGMAAPATMGEPSSITVLNGSANDLGKNSTAADLLKRDSPRKPLSVLAAPASPVPPPEPDTLPKRWRLVHRTVATAAGILDAEGMTLVLPGIDVVSVDEICTTSTNVHWPCGMAARTAFRAYLRGRAMNCRLPDAASEKTMLTECLLQGEDPALWLVKNGWARAKADGQLVIESQLAREKARGIFGRPER